MLFKALPSIDKPVSLRDAVRMVGKLGGHLGRKCNGEPGITVLWRGMMRLYEDVEMMHAYSTAMKTSNSS